MITLVQGSRPTTHNHLVDAMFKARAVVFRDRLGWAVDVRNGRERDRYDDLDPLYLVSVGPTGVARASIRLMPTTGPTLLSDVFADTFDEPVDLKSATLWEATRFCIHPEADPRAEQSIAAEILMGICEVGLMSGLTGIIGVYDPRLIRIYGRIGWQPEPLARSTRYGTGPIYVGLWEVSERALAGMRARAGVAYSVLDGVPADVRAA